MAEDATGNGNGMVSLVADNAMVIEAATTEIIVEATTQRRPEARDIFEPTLRHMVLLRAKAEAHSPECRGVSPLTYDRPGIAQGSSWECSGAVPILSQDTQ